MRHLPKYLSFFLFSVTATGCSLVPSASEVGRAVKVEGGMDAQTAGEIVLAVGSPEESVRYFEDAVANDPKSISHQRGLAVALARTGDHARSAEVWRRVGAHPQATTEDQVDYASSLIRIGAWQQAESVLGAAPPSDQSAKRARLEAVIADSKQDWKRADEFYQIALRLSETPASIYNNWGFSQLSRKNYTEAERLLLLSIKEEPSLFTAKNNLAMARAGMKNYQLPQIDMTQQERAELTYTMAVVALQQDDVTAAKMLLREAIDSHPFHFEAALRTLKEIEGS